MNILTRRELKELLRQTGTMCLSLYLPTHRAGQQVDQDPIRFKNLLREAANSLEQLGMKTRAVEERLGPASGLLRDTFFWTHQTEGLAVFLGDHGMQYFHLPVSCDELAVAGKRYHTKPLIPLLTNNDIFYILAVGLKSPKLFVASRFSVDEVPLDDVPDSLEEALRFDDPEKQLQFHTGTGSTKGRRAAVFHGQGAGMDDAERKKDIVRYFHQVNRGVQEVLRDETARLVLAGVDYLLPLYAETNSYPHTSEQVIASNPDELEREELGRRAWEIVRPDILRKREEAVNMYGRLRDHKKTKTSDKVAEILSASALGRVDNIFIPSGEYLWGVFYPERQRVDIHISRSAGDEDLLDTAAAWTFLHGGGVFVVERREIPGNGVIAATFRY